MVRVYGKKKKKFTNMEHFILATLGHFFQNIFLLIFHFSNSQSHLSHNLNISCKNELQRKKKYLFGLTNALEMSYKSLYHIILSDWHLKITSKKSYLEEKFSRNRCGEEANFIAFCPLQYSHDVSSLQSYFSVIKMRG